MCRHKSAAVTFLKKGCPPAGTGEFARDFPLLMLRHLSSLSLTAALLLSAPLAHAAKKAGEDTFRCAGAICVDAATGKVLAEENANTQNPPASVTKLMTLLLVLDEVHAGKLKLTDVVTADDDAKAMGGTQVALSVGEKHTVEELLYALMVQSANDAAIALAKHVAGSKQAFVARMNTRAAELGMTRTVFQSPHGLPPSRKSGDVADLTTARDLAKVSVALLATQEALKYTSVKTYRFRPLTGDPKADAPGTYNNLSNHNKLLGTFAGCDGLKTGWTNAGASIVTTASRGNKRVIAVVLGGIVPGSEGRPDPRLSQRRRDDKAARLMEEGLASLGVAGASPTPYVAAPAIAPAASAIAPAAAPVAAPVAAGDAANNPAAAPAVKPAAPTVWRKW